MGNTTGGSKENILRGGHPGRKTPKMGGEKTHPGFSKKGKKGKGLFKEKKAPGKQVCARWG